MVGYTSTVREQAKKASRKISNGTFRRNKAKELQADKENQPNNANVKSTPTNKVQRKKAKSLTKTASRTAGQPKSDTVTPLQNHNKKPVPKTTPPRYTSIEAVDDPFETLRDLPRTPVDPNDGLSPTSQMYRIDHTVDLVELGPSHSSHSSHSSCLAPKGDLFLSPILIRYSSPPSSPIKPFSLPTSPPSPSLSLSPSPSFVLDESHLSEVSLGAPTPQKTPKGKGMPMQKAASVFDLRASGALPNEACTGAILATPRKVVVLSGSKKKRTFSPSKQYPNLTLADMLHDLSFDGEQPGDEDPESFPVAEDVAEVSKEEFLWSMKSGFEFLKHGKRGKPHKRLVWFELDKGAICWTECGKKKKYKTKRMMFLHEVVDIVYGTATAVSSIFCAIHSSTIFDIASHLHDETQIQTCAFQSYPKKEHSI